MQEVVLVANMGAAGRFFRGGIAGDGSAQHRAHSRDLADEGRLGVVRLARREGAHRDARDAGVVGRRARAPRARLEGVGHDHGVRRRARRGRGLRGRVVRAPTRPPSLYDIACETNIMLAPSTPHASCTPAPNSPPASSSTKQASPASGLTSTPHSRVSAARNPVLSHSRMAKEGAWSGTKDLGVRSGGSGADRHSVLSRSMGRRCCAVESASRPDFLRVGQYADMFDALNCGKRSVTLNLKQPGRPRTREAVDRRVG